MPLVVPRTMDADTAMHVGVPKLLLPASENAWPFIFCSFVHLTTSHGGEGVSVSPTSRARLLVTETLRLWAARNAGDDGRGEPIPGEDSREENLRSKGLKEGVGLPKPGRDPREGSMLLLLGNEANEPWKKVSQIKIYCQVSPQSYLHRWRVVWYRQAGIGWTVHSPWDGVGRSIIRSCFLLRGLSQLAIPTADRAHPTGYWCYWRLGFFLGYVGHILVTIWLYRVAVAARGRIVISGKRERRGVCVGHGIVVLAATTLPRYTHEL